MTSPAQNFNEHTNLSEAEKSLKEWDIKYTKDPITGIITVPHGLVIAGMNLRQLPDLSAVIVIGCFSCHSNQLTSLIGSPQTVSENLFCHNNKLTDLVGAPEIKNHMTWCQGNPLEDMHGASKTSTYYKTPFGNFNSWGEIPDDIKKSPARIAREIEREKAELCKKIKAEIHAGTTRELHTARIKFIKKKPAP